MSIKYEIPVSWQMYGKISVVADSLEDAINKVLKDSALPKEQLYIDDSIIVNTDDVFYN